MSDQQQTTENQESESQEQQTAATERPPQFVEAEVMDDVRTSVQQSRAMIPVTEQGAQPTTFAQEVDFAKTMALSLHSLPKFLRGNPGDCLAIIDISKSAGLRPYMVAKQCYVGPDGQMAFMSQLSHALVIQSNRLKEPALNFRFEGEGDDMVCVVWATLKGEDKPREHRSPPLSKVRPPIGDKGVRKGSPLWDKKPYVQLFYDTSRDWGRLHCPIAALGVLSAFESQETPIAQEPETTLHDRLKGSDKTEGHQNGHAAEELARTAADNATLKPAGDGAAGHTTIKPAKADKKAAAKPPADEKRATTLETGKPATKKQASAAADRAQAASDARKRESDEKKTAAEAKKPEQKTDDPPPPVPTKPKNDAEYNVYCRDWIDRTPDPEAAIKRWDDELQMRDDITVRIPTRNNLREYLEKKHGV